MLGRKLSHILSKAMAGIQNHLEGGPCLLQHVLRPGEIIGTRLPSVNVAHYGLTTLIIH